MAVKIPGVDPSLKKAVVKELQELTVSVEFRKRLDAYRAVFEKTNRIISGRPVNVQISDPLHPNLTEAPGWTDGETVYLNGPVLQRDLQQLKGQDIAPLVMALKGINYHELAHVLYTPRISDDICRRIVERAQSNGDYRWWYAFNALEDQRIETWFVATYRPAHRYFESIALKWLVSNRQSLAEAYILVHGRKFLPAKIRRTARKAFAAKYGDKLTSEFAEVIDEYLGVVLPQDTNRAFGLVKRFRDLLEEAMMAHPPDLLTADNNPTDVPNKGQVRDDLIKKGRTIHKDQKAARDNAGRFVERANAEDAKLAEQESAVGGGSESGEGAPSTGADKGDKGGTNKAPIEDILGPRSNVAHKGGGDEVGAGTGVGTGQGNAINEQEGQDGTDLADLLNEQIQQVYDALDEAVNDPELQADVKATAAAIRAASQMGEADAQGKQSGFTESSAQPEQRSLVRRMVHVLERLRLDLEPTWLKRQTKGRVNVKRVMTSQPWDTDVFDQWDEGNEELGGVEVVVLIDQSGSMNGLIHQASEALWVLKRAFDELDIRTTVLGYSDGHKILYKPSDKAKLGDIRTFKTYGTTNPTTALREALQVLSKSREPNRVLITITDGQWGGANHQILGLVRAIQRLGTTTVLLGLNSAVQSYGKHGHELGHDMRRIRELPDIALKIVTNIMQKVAVRT